MESGVYDRANIKMELPLADTISQEEITALLESYGNAYQKIKTATDEFPKKCGNGSHHIVNGRYIRISAPADSEAHSTVVLEDLLPNREMRY